MILENMALFFRLGRHNISFFAVLFTDCRLSYCSRSHLQSYRSSTSSFIYVEQEHTVECWDNNLFKVALSPLKKHLCYLLHWKPFKNDKKYFIFHLKNSFRSQDIYVFIMTFGSCRKNGLIREIRLISELMMSQPG